MSRQLAHCHHNRQCGFRMPKCFITSRSSELRVAALTTTIFRHGSVCFTCSTCESTASLPRAPHLVLPWQKHGTEGRNWTEHRLLTPTSSTTHGCSGLIAVWRGGLAAACFFVAGTGVPNIAGKSCTEWTLKAAGSVSCTWSNNRAGVWRKQDWRKSRRSGWSIAGLVAIYRSLPCLIGLRPLLHDLPLSIWCKPDTVPSTSVVQCRINVLRSARTLAYSLSEKLDV